MENKIRFLSLDKLYSEKKGKDYFKLICLLDNRNCDIFITEETYKKLSIRDFKYLEELNAVFTITNRYGNVSLELVDLKPLK